MRFFRYRKTVEERLIDKIEYLVDRTKRTDKTLDEISRLIYHYRWVKNNL